MRICFFLHNLSFHGGTERISIALANELAMVPDYRIYMLSLEPFKYPFFPLDNEVESDSLYLENAKIRENYFNAISALRAYLKKNKIDVIIDVDVILSSISLPATRFLRTKVVSWEHYNYYTKTESVVRRISRKAAAFFSNALVTLTQQDVSFYRKHCICRTHLLSIPNFVPSVDNLYNSSSKKILAIGHLEYRKGFDLLIKAWALLSPEVRNKWQLFIVGEGPEKQNLQAQIEKENLTDEIFISPLTTEINVYYRQTSIYAMTSRAEGLPMVLLEAKSYGIPLIAFDCSTGPSEIINDNEDGFLIPAFDVPLFAEKLQLLMEKEFLRLNMSIVAKQDIERFSISKSKDRWIELLERCMI